MPEDPYKYFRIEAQELLAHMQEGTLALEKPGADAALVGRLLRYAHTFKGAARVVKQLRMAEAAHQFEELLTPHRELQQPWSAGQSDPLLAQLDIMAKLLALLNTPSQPTAAGGFKAPVLPPPRPEARPAGGVWPTVPIAARPRPAPTPPQAAAPPSPPATRTPPPATDAASASTHAVVPPPSTAGQTRKEERKEERARTLRAQVSELDAVLDGLREAQGELGNARSKLGRGIDQATKLAELGLRQLAVPHKHDPRQLERALERGRALTSELLQSLRALERVVGPGLERTSRELTDVRDTAERLLLVPAQGMFSALERAVRDAARDVGKQVFFEAHGGETRLDSALLEVAQSALFHVVRNAVVHGIETPDVRRAHNKPSLGRIRVEVRQRGGQVVFACQDDGRGVDVAAVRAALQTRRPDASTLTDEEVLHSLLVARVSTATTVSEVAGRGVGLDVLREAAEQLNGDVQLRSEAGTGLLVQLIAPVSAAALMGLWVESAGATAALPLASVVQCVRLPADAVANDLDGESVVHEGKVIPFLPLSRSLGPREERARTKPHSAVVLRAANDQRLAVGVDRVLGARLVVLRPLPPLAAATPVVAGAALSAAGKAELVLDPEGLFEALSALGSRRSLPAAATKRLLVVDDSITTRMLEQSILEGAGYRVDLAASGEEGLEKARAGVYSAILVDVEMPGIDGFEFIERLRADPQLRATPAVLVSSRSDPEDLRRGTRVGASGYIVKGRFDQRELLQLIRGLVGS
ncbi:MAG: response regulator [Polyangiales bacterium]